MSERDFRTMFCWSVGCLTGGNIYIFIFIYTGISMMMMMVVVLMMPTTIPVMMTIGAE